MRARESGMPDEADWMSFFNPEATIDALIGADGVAGDLVEFGCGYGTFTVPSALRTRGRVTALDIDPRMVARLQQKVTDHALSNVRAVVRDFIAHGTGLADGSQAHAMIYNLLHLDSPIALLREAHRVLCDGGSLSVIHWRSDIPTPRGPSLAIRPTPEQCWEWMAEAGFQNIEPVDLKLCCPFHFGLVARH